MIVIKKGEDYKKYLRIQYADTQEAVNLTGCVVKSQLRNVPGGDLAGDGVCTWDASTGDITVKFDSDITSALTPGDYGYDVWIVDDTGDKHPIYTVRCKVVDPYTIIEEH